MTLSIVVEQRPLAYALHLDWRALESVDLVVIHATELPDLASAREYGERIVYPDSGTGSSGHLYIDRDGRIEQWVPLERVAHHVRGINERSIGIELVNRGRYPDWFDSRSQNWPEAYPEAQIGGLIRLLAELEGALPALQWIAGHEELDTEWVAASDDPDRKVRRKLDPGPGFPWPRVLEACRLEPVGDRPAVWR